MSIIVSKQRLVELQRSIIMLTDEVREGHRVDIGRLEDKVVDVIRYFAELKPSNTISEIDKFSLNVEKLILLQQSIMHLADEFEEGKYVDVREAERRIKNVCDWWINLGKF